MDEPDRKLMLLINEAFVKAMINSLAEVKKVGFIGWGILALELLRLSAGITGIAARYMKDPDRFIDEHAEMFKTLAKTAHSIRDSHLSATAEENPFDSFGDNIGN
jgi:hypothetical protein